MKKLTSLLLAFVFTFSANAPVFAQHMVQKAPQAQKTFTGNETIELLNKMSQEAAKNRNPFDTFPRFFDKGYPQAVVARDMKYYNSVVEDYRNSTAVKFSPQEVMDAMKYETDKMGRLLANNPRYKKELRKQQWMQTGQACAEGILVGALVVLCAPAALTYGGASAGAWFGLSATAAATTTYATVSIGRAIFVVALLEMFTYLGQDIMENIYENLSKRILKYKYLENNAKGRAVVESAAKGSILNENVLQSFQTQCSANNEKSLHLSMSWADKEAKKEALIRLAGLQAINTNLAYSSDKTKYDMALLDILSLFTDESVQFDEKVFTRETVANGAVRVEKNSSIVDINPGRLMPRTPELRKALVAISEM